MSINHTLYHILAVGSLRMVCFCVWEVTGLLPRPLYHWPRSLAHIQRTGKDMQWGPIVKKSHSKIHHIHDFMLFWRHFFVKNIIIIYYKCINVCMWYIWYMYMYFNKWKPLFSLYPILPITEPQDIIILKGLMNICILVTKRSRARQQGCWIFLRQRFSTFPQGFWYLMNKVIKTEEFTHIVNIM